MELKFMDAMAALSYAFHSAGVEGKVSIVLKMDRNDRLRAQAMLTTEAGHLSRDVQYGSPTKNIVEVYGIGVRIEDKNVP